MKATMVSVVTVTPEDGVTIAELHAILQARALDGQIVTDTESAVVVTTLAQEVDI